MHSQCRTLVTLENDSVTDKEITADNIYCNNNYYNYYTEIILYLCVCALQLILQVLLTIYTCSIRLQEQC